MRSFFCCCEIHESAEQLQKELAHGWVCLVSHAHEKLKYLLRFYSMFMTHDNIPVSVCELQICVIISSSFYLQWCTYCCTAN